MRGITADCIVEMFDRKTIYIFGVITMLAVVIILFTGSMDVSIDFYSEGNVDLKQMGEMIGDPVMRVYGSFMSLIVFLAVLATAGLIPNMLIKGRAEYFLSQPLSRASFIYNKIFGIWITYGGVIVLCGVIGYASIYLVHGIFDKNILYLFMFNLISFFIWLSITSFAGIVFGSNAMALMTAFLAWVVQYILRYHEIIKDFIESKPAGMIVDMIYYVFPKTGELSDLTLRLAMGKIITDWMPLYSTVIFAFVLLGVTSYLFNRKNY